MNLIARSLLLPVEAVVYGPTYGYLQFLIRSPRPLDEEKTWQTITAKIPPLANWIRRHYPPAFARPLLLWAKLRQDHWMGISAHYDVSNDFYEQFLDKKYMFYTCADFPTGNESLEEAQTIKADFILNLIDPKPGEKILELGCGWGPMLKRIYEHTGDKENLYGYTLSKEQVAYNEKHNQFNVEYKNFITTDYRDEFYDKIYSIGAWEHVRKRDTLMLLRKLYAALKPGGRLVQHFFTGTNRTMGTGALVAQIFFPGSMPAPFQTQMRWAEEAGFRITHHSVHDYRDTLRAWFENLVQNRERALELVGVKTYNKYIVFFAASWKFFDEVDGQLSRYVFQKP